MELLVSCLPTCLQWCGRAGRETTLESRGEGDRAPPGAEPNLPRGSPHLFCPTDADKQATLTTNKDDTGDNNNIIVIIIDSGISVAYDVGCCNCSRVPRRWVDWGRT